MARNGYNNSREFDALLKGPEVRGELDRLTQRAASRAGSGFESETSVGRGRALGMVYPATRSASSRERREHVLMRAQDAFREGG
ncbi:MAG TPA: hypothetical protein VK039_09000 [Brevibacterium sp.]|nr:hypothetical protein [Brevibacterium sp.]